MMVMQDIKEHVVVKDYTAVLKEIKKIVKKHKITFEELRTLIANCLHQS